MNPFVSVYIDGLRIVAAMSVLIYHWGLRHGQRWVTGGDHGHDAVIVFFVISGFVIAFAADRKPSFRDYVFDRVTRVYSVAFPSLILAALAFPLIGPDPVPSSWSWKSIFLNLTFLNWSWANAEIIPYLGVWWSLSYEVWYYALFAVVVFQKGWQRVFCAALISVIAGPKVLLLAPCWWFGVLAYRHWRKLEKFRHSIIFIIAPLITYAAAKWIGLRDLIAVASLLGPLWEEPIRLRVIGLSRWFPWDYFLAALTLFISLELQRWPKHG